MSAYNDYVYYGDDQKIFDYFEKNTIKILGAELKHLKSFKEVNIHFQYRDEYYPSVLFYQQGMFLENDLLQLKVLTTKYTDSLVFLIGEGFSAAEKQRYLDAGVTNTISPYASEDVFESLRRYFHLYFEAMSQTKSFKTIDFGFSKMQIPRGKRIFDIVLSVIFILLLCPVFILIYLAIKIESAGPAVYRSKRVGAGYYMFDFYKFRSMFRDADKRLKEYMALNQYAKQAIIEVSEHAPLNNTGFENSVFDEIDLGELLIDDDAVTKRSAMRKKQKKSAFFKLEKDPRVTRVGKMLRKYSLDELPQLFNVLKGDMSIVGNRPLPLYEAEALTTDESVERFMAPAGITGLWQVEKRGDNGSMSDQERIELDVYYAKNYTIWMDVKILFKTLFAFIQKADV